MKESEPMFTNYDIAFVMFMGFIGGLALGGVAFFAYVMASS